MAGDFTVDNDGQCSFVPPDPVPHERPPLIDPIDVLLWTRNKARLVRDYLILFVQFDRRAFSLERAMRLCEDGIERYLERH